MAESTGLCFKPQDWGLQNGRPYRSLCSNAFAAFTVSSAAIKKTNALYSTEG